MSPAPPPEVRLVVPLADGALELSMVLEGPMDPAGEQELRTLAAFVSQSPLATPVEHALRATVRALCLPPGPGERRPRLRSARATLRTADGQTLTASADDPPFVEETPPWGRVHVVDEPGAFGLYRLAVAPGATLPGHVHRRTREHELVLTDGLLGWEGDEAPRPLAAGDHRQWPLDLVHGYHNPGARPAAIFCIDAPPFDPSDEVVVP